MKAVFKCYYNFLICILAIAVNANSAPIFWGSADDVEETQNQQEAQPAEQDLQASKEIENTFATKELSNKIIKSFGSENPGIGIKTGSIFDQVAIKLASGTKHEVIKLENPSRLVIDLFGVDGTNGMIPANGSRFMRQIRTAEHSDKTRVVLDLVEDNSPAYDIKEDSENLIVTLSDEGKIQEAVQMASMTAAETSPESGAIKAQFKSEDDQIKVKEIVPEPLAKPMIEAESGPALQAVRIESVSPTSNRIVADLANAGTYTFSKTAPSEYVLNLEKTKLLPSVQDSVVAKPGMGTIRSARAFEVDNGVQVRIFADPTTMLKVKSDGEKIIIADYKDEAAGSDMMAQAIVEEETEKTPEVKKKDTSPTFDIKVDTEESTPTVVETPNKKVEELEESEAPAKKPEVKTEIKVEEASLEEDFAGLEDKTYTGRLISLDLQDTDIDNALRIIAEVSNLNIIASEDVAGKVTLRLIDVPWDQALDVILKTNGLDKVQDGNVVRIAPVEKLRSEREALKQAKIAEEELEPLKVSYVRISYAKADELKALVESVVTERGTVTHDQRTNQLIVKDIEKGLKNVTKLVEKLDLRTPQVLIETQIVEAQRRFVREIGSELGFSWVRSPETGNATGYNFPNSIGVGGSAKDSAGAAVPGNIGSFYPATDQSSAISLLFGSADGTKGLTLRLSQGEKDGLVKVISRPSVAVTNNQPAEIKSVETIRIKLPSGGGVTLNQGNQAGGNGGGDVATEQIDVGITLTVTAQASPDYFVLLDVKAVSSTLGARDRGVDTIPPVIERSANSSVLVSSGQTFAMGGIYKLSENDGISGVPFLKDIPFLGQFFRQSSVTDSDEELIFFITPRIIEGSFDDAAMRSVS